MHDILKLCNAHKVNHCVAQTEEGVCGAACARYKLCNTHKGHCFAVTAEGVCGEKRYRRNATCEKY